jgi:hypothetical protein
VKRAVIGGIIGSFIAMLLILASETMTRRRAADADTSEFLKTLSEMKRGMLNPFGGRRRSGTL